jgi:hypothetical protein
MLTLLTAAAIATAPAPQPAPAAEAPKAEAPCDMPCCKDKPMPCCEKMHGQKKAEAPEAEGHGGHEHDH